MLEDQLNSSSITLDESLLQYDASVDPSLTTSTNVATPTPVRNGGLSTTTTTGATGIQDIDGVLAGIQWTNKNLTYSFPTLSTQYGTYSSGELTTFAAVNATMQTAIKNALAQYASFSGLTFTQNTASPGSATLRFGMSASASPTAYAYYPSGAVQGGDVWFGTQTGGSAMTNPLLGNYAFISAMHELGHALGLKHGQETGGPANTAMTAAHDSMEYSIMSYLSYTGGPATGYTNEQWGFAQTPMMYDIAAIQDMYGANFSGPSSQIYSFDPATGQELINGVGQGTPGGNRIFRTIWDGGGNAEYDFSNYTTNETVDLTPGGYSTLSAVQLAYLGSGHYADGEIFNALQYNGDVRSLIRFVKLGSGTNTAVGNAANNVMEGGSGDNTITTGAGADVILFTLNDMKGTHTDTITDYVSGTDVLRLEGISASAITFSGTAGAPTILVNNGTGTTTFNLASLASKVTIVVGATATTDLRTLTAASFANASVITYDYSATGTAAKRSTKTYDGAGLLSSSLIVFADNSGSNTYYDTSGRTTEVKLLATDGSTTSDVKTVYLAGGARTETYTGTNYGQYTYLKSFNASNVLTEQVTSGFTGRAYTALDDFYDATGRVTEEKQTTSTGALYSDEKIVYNAGGITVHTYSGSAYGQYTNIETLDATGHLQERVTTGYTGQPFTSTDTLFDATNRTIELKEITSTGTTYYDAKTVYNVGGGTTVTYSGSLYGQYSYANTTDATGHLTDQLMSGFTGRPYTAVDFFYDASNRTIEEKQLSSTGVTYYDAKTVFNAGGGTTITYSGSLYGQYSYANTTDSTGHLTDQLMSGFTGRPYTAVDFFYDASNRTIEEKYILPTGVTYYDAKTVFNAGGGTTITYYGSLYGQYSYANTTDSTGHLTDQLMSGFTGRPYTAVDFFYDASNRTIEEKYILPTGVTYYDAKTVFNAGGGTTITYSGSLYGQYSYANTTDSTGHLTDQLMSGFTGRPYTSVDYFYDTSNRVIEEKQVTSTGVVYSDIKTIFNAGGSTNITYSGTAYGTDIISVDTSAGGVQLDKLTTHIDGSKVYEAFGNSQTLTSTGAARDTLIGYGSGDLFVIHAGFTTEEVSGVTAVSGGHPFQFDASLFANYAAFISAAQDNGSGGVTATALNGSTFIVDNISKSQLAGL